MASYLHRVILIALILSITIKISIGYTKNSENECDWEEDSDAGIEDGDDSYTRSDDSKIVRYLRDLCSDIEKSKQCWKIIKPEINGFTNSNSQNITGVVIDLAIEKSDEIKDKLNQLHQDSRDDSLKKKYLSCSRKYNDAHRELEIVKGNLDYDDYRRIQDGVEDVARELKRCKHEFGKNSNDPAHIWDRNREFGRYVEIVKTATKHFVKEKDSDSTRKTQFH